MRTAYLVNVYPAVSHSFVRREIVALEARGHSVLRLAIRAPSGTLADPADRQEALHTTTLTRLPRGVLVKTLIAGTLGNLGAFLRTAGFAFRLARRSGLKPAKMAAYLAEAVVVRARCREAGVALLRVHFGTNAAVVARLARRLGGAPYSVAVHGPDEFDAPERWDLRGLVGESAFSTAISHFCAGQMMRWSDHGDWPRIEIVPCGVDASFLAPAPWPAGDGAGPRRLVTVARLAPQKGLPVLVDALARAVGQGADLALDLVGDGPGRAALERQVAEAGLGARVRFHGSLSGAGVAQVIAGAHAMVLPSFAEGLPVVLMEAMGLGRPVIATAVAAIPELVRDGENGWIVPSGDPQALAAALTVFAAAPPEELHRLGQAAHAAVAAGHAVEAAAARLDGAMARHLPAATGPAGAPVLSGRP